MTQLYDRKCVVIVCKVPGDDLTEKPAEAKRIEGLRVQFKVQKSDKPEPNKAEILIYNLSEELRAELDQDKGVRVLLQAGYKDDLAQLFAGESRFVNHKVEGVDVVTKIEALDGGRAYRFARANESFGPGAKVGDVVKKLVGQLAKDPGNALQKAGEMAREFVDGYTVSGPAAAELSSLLEAEGYSWSIQDGRVELLKATETLADEVPLLSPDTGLIGSPELSAPEKKKGPAQLKCKALLMPQLRPGSKFRLESKGRKGDYKAKAVGHSGDTHGNDWYTEIAALPLT